MKRLITVGFVCLLFAGCGTPSHLVYVHGTTLGLDVAASTEGTGRFVFGYDRDTYSIIPSKKALSEAELTEYEQTKDESTKENLIKKTDVMSLAAVSCIHAEGLDDVQFKHFVSTGKAAINVVKQPKVLALINQSIQGGESERCSPKLKTDNAATPTGDQ